MLKFVSDLIILKLNYRYLTLFLKLYLELNTARYKPFSLSSVQIGLIVVSKAFVRQAKTDSGTIATVK